MINMKNKKPKFNSDTIQKIIINPYYAVNFHPTYAVSKLEPLITKKEWVKANVNLMREIGIESWLSDLLSVLEGDFITNEDVMNND